MPTILIGDAFGATRDALQAALLRQGADSRRVYYPIHTMPPYASAAAAGCYPVAEWLSERGLNLPNGAALTDADQAHIIECIADEARGGG
jgi:perosamine synthetase